MIFQGLVLENFDPCKGRQVFNLHPGTEQQTFAPALRSNIVLFSGMNGGGKTTLMDAIWLALYGHRAPCSTRGNWRSTKRMMNIL